MFGSTENGKCMRWSVIELDVEKKAGKLVSGGMIEATLESMKFRSYKMTSSDRVLEQKWVSFGEDNGSIAAGGSTKESFCDIIEENIIFVHVVHSH